MKTEFRHGNSVKRILLWAVVVLFALVGGIAAYGALTLSRAQGGLPEWDGEVGLDGLVADVRIRRDGTGTPFIEAETEKDLLFAQGFVHAQDRFWQMAVGRQAALGGLSEWLGALTVSADRVARMWGWVELADRSFEALPAEDRELMEAYAAGVNAWLAGPTYRRPPEMVILHVDPEPWQARDAFLVIYSLHRLLAAPGSERDQASLALNGAEPEAIDILVDRDVPAPPIVPSRSGIAVTQPTVTYKSQEFSDNWTVSGEHAATGLPLMANDPQLPASLPGTWQLQHHAIGDEDRRAGGSLPGLPGIVVGHNGAISWGMTNSLIDLVDVAYLQVDTANPDRYRRGPESEWASFNTTPEVIPVRFGRDQTAVRRRTPQGVVWPAGLPSPYMGASPDRAVELRDVALDLTTTTPAALLGLNRARSVEEGIEAVRGITVPSLNLSFADTAGSIGYILTGRIPVRPEEHASRVGFAPEDGSDWSYLGFDDNPRVVDPPGGRIVSANQQIVDADFPHFLADRWPAPRRAWRIHELLNEESTHDIESFVAMQSDRLSYPARTLVPLMLQVEPATEADAALLALLRDWDYRFDLDSPSPTIWLTWYDALRRAVLADELGGDQPIWGTMVMYRPLARALSGERADWCDRRDTDAVEGCAGWLQQSLTEARIALEESFGPGPASWAWGEAAEFNLGHLGFAGLPVLGERFSRRTPIPGGPGSLFMNGVRVDDAPRFSTSLFTSTFQAVYDLSDLDASVFMTMGGPSGHFASPFYNNRTEAWVDGDRIRLSPESLEPMATLRLTPR